MQSGSYWIDLHDNEVDSDIEAQNGATISEPTCSTLRLRR